MSFRASWDVSHLLWGLDVTATKVVVQSASHRTAASHVAMSMLNSRVTSADTQTLI